jgi:uncharacterized protein YqhQ
VYLALIGLWWPVEKAVNKESERRRKIGLTSEKWSKERKNAAASLVDIVGVIFFLGVICLLSLFLSNLLHESFFGEENFYNTRGLGFLKGTLQLCVFVVIWIFTLLPLHKFYELFWYAFHKERK